MNEINELEELIGPEFQVNVMAARVAGRGLEFALELTAMAAAGTRDPDTLMEAYAEITRRFGELYARLMSHERWTARDDPDVRVRFVERERAFWQLDGTLVKRATYYVSGEGSITLVRTSRT